MNKFHCEIRIVGGVGLYPRQYDGGGEWVGGLILGWNRLLTIKKFIRMAGAKELGEIYDLILLSPGLNERIKLDSRISCRTALQLVMALEYGLSNTDADNPLRKILSEEDRGTLKGLTEEVLQKASLKEFYERLKKIG